jgi:hypothetical protein
VFDCPKILKGVDWLEQGMMVSVENNWLHAESYVPRKVKSSVRGSDSSLVGILPLLGVMPMRRDCS